VSLRRRFAEELPSGFASAAVNQLAPMYLNELATWRAERDTFFASHYASPLSDDAMAAFSGLRYFPPDPQLVFETALNAATSRVRIKSSMGIVSEYPAGGTVMVPFPTGTVVLRVLCGEEDDLFVPFRDSTSGDTTYAAGRYVSVEKGRGGLVTIDFNKAINPYCTYDPDFSCPLPPRENRLAFSIEAGELDYRDPTVDD